MKSNFRKVQEFHEIYGQDIDEEINRKNRQLRLKLMEEELDEVTCALYEDPVNKANVAKELADLLYVVYGTGVTWGIDLDECFKLVHESNMSKLGEDGKPIYRDDGKILKGPNYKPPDLTEVINEKHRSRDREN